MNGPDLCFVCPPGGSVFIDELVEVVADGVRRAGGRARTVTGAFPVPDADTVFVVVPHEYFPAGTDPDRVAPSVLHRTIALCVEHPGTATFERSAALLGVFGAVVDINADSTSELVRRGFRPLRLQLGHSPLWDRWGGDLGSPRPHGALYLGTADPRRSRILASCAADLDDTDHELLCPPHEPMRLRRPDFLPGEDKLHRLATTRVLVNLHRSGSRCLEWVRVLEAICNGCVVVTEPSTDQEPLVPGLHALVSRTQDVGAVTAALLRDPDLELRIREDAYAWVRSELDFTGSCRHVVDVATDLLTHQGAQAPRPTPPARALTTAPTSPLAVDTPPWAQPGAGPATLRAPRRRRHETGTPIVAGTVDVLVADGPESLSAEELLADLVTGTHRPDGLLVAAAAPGSAAGPHGSITVRVAAAAGPGVVRTALLDASSAEWLVALDPDMRASRRLLEDLLRAQQLHDADVVHCMVADPEAGLVGALPAEPARLAAEHYLGAGYLVRRSMVDELGCWTGTTDPDRAFWLAAVAAGARTHLVPRVRLRRQLPASAHR